MHQSKRIPNLMEVGKNHPIHAPTSMGGPGGPWGAPGGPRGALGAPGGPWGPLGP